MQSVTTGATAPCPSIEERSAWQCPEHGAGTPLRLFGKTLHCVLCGDECEPRPSWLAAAKHHAKHLNESENARLLGLPPPAPVRGAPPERYGCHNRPNKSMPYFAPSGHMVVTSNEAGLIVTGNIRVKVERVMSTDCKYDKRASDSKCAGCNHNKTGDSV